MTLQPYTYREHTVDLVNENESLIYVNVERNTNIVIFRIEGPIEYGFNNSKIVTIQNIYPRDPTEKPFEYFWTPPALDSWDFIFENPYDTPTNITIKIIVYSYNLEWPVKVTYYQPPLDRTFAYAGTIIIAASIMPNVYYLYKTRKKTDKLLMQQDEAEKTREHEETGKLK